MFIEKSTTFSLEQNVYKLFRITLLFVLLATPSYSKDIPDTTLAGHAALTSMGAAARITTELFKKQLAPAQCRWCDRDKEGRDTLNAVDREIRTVFKWKNSDAANRFSDIAAFGISPFFALSGIAGGRLLGVRDREIFENALIVVEAAVLSSDVNQIIKFAAGRERPFVHFLSATERDRTRNPSDNNLSFFSGHSTWVFSLVVSAGTTAQIREYAWAPYIWGAGLSLAAATGYLRIAADRHYFTDVLTGALMGSAFGFGVPYFFYFSDRESPKVNFIPLERRGGMLVAQWNF